jgi:hypothetical protein
MLFNHCANTAVKNALEDHFFSTLQTELSLAFKRAKSREIFAKFLGFPNYNHAKPQYDKLPDGDAVSLLSPFVKLAESISTAEVCDHFIEFLASELHSPLTEDRRKEVWAKFAAPLHHSLTHRIQVVQDDTNKILTGDAQIIGSASNVGKTKLAPTELYQSPELSIYSAESDEYWRSITDNTFFSSRTTVLLHSLLYTCRVTPVVHGINANKQDYRTFIAAPPAMVDYLQGTIEGLYKSKPQAIRSRRDLESGFSEKVVIVSEYQLDNIMAEDLARSQVLWLYFPSRFGLHTKRFQTIKNKLDEAEKRIVIVDSVQSITKMTGVPDQSIIDHNSVKQLVINTVKEAFN